MNNAFLNDYNEICHKNVYEFIAEHISDQEPGYCEDRFCREAGDKIRELIESKDSQVQFFIGGTSTNLTMISFMLNHSYEAVIATKYAHISIHEGGAIEGCGHQIIEAEDKDGKILPESIEKIYLEHKNDRHMVMPKLVFISNSTEIGTLYTLEELKAIYKVCKKYDLYLYLDGARLLVAATSKYNNISLSDYAKYTDVFYIGGTKHGIMLGEAAVINNDNLKRDLLRHMKNKGSMLAKGSLIGLNFLALFNNDLYKEIGVNANECAMMLASGFKDRNFSFAYPPVSNQIFVNVEEDIVEKLSKHYGFADLGNLYPDHPNLKTLRFVTSFATTKKDVEELFKTVDELI